MGSTSAPLVTLIAECVTPFLRERLREESAAHSNMSDKVGNVPFCFYARGRAANMVRGRGVYGMEKNYAKYRAYALAYTMIDNALEHCCPLQAITIEESILSDRLWSTLNVGLGKRKLGTLGQALREWKPKGAGVRNPNAARFDAEMELLFPRIEKWWNCRNDLLHGIAKSWQGEGPVVDASDFQSKAMAVAKEGLTLANKVKAWTQKQIRHSKKRHEGCED